MASYRWLAAAGSIFLSHHFNISRQLSTSQQYFFLQQINTSHPPAE
jgi:hypothetical protein